MVYVRLAMLFSLAAVNLTIRLADGELARLSHEQMDDLYESLWAQARRGSVMAALKIRDGRYGRERLIRLTEQESVAFREALQRLSDS